MRIKRVDADSWQHEGEKRALEMGQRVHQVLANIHDAGDLQALEERLKTDGIEETWVTAILQMLAHPDIAPFFAPGQSVRTEADILLPDGHLLRPDRILFLQDSTQVLDYKTGNPHPGHHAQLRQYLDKLEEMGYPGPLGGWSI
jgi:ATP-dependent exoDNAse (exonuclease V) beta subunit